MSDNERCPICGTPFTGVATSRATNTPICDDCAMWEALNPVGRVSVALAVAQFRYPRQRLYYLYEQYQLNHATPFGQTPRE